MLCNLAACCIQLKVITNVVPFPPPTDMWVLSQEWGKVIKFCEQCLLLRPQCARALVRRGTAYLHVGEFDKSLQDLRPGEELTNDLAEKGRVKILIGRASRARMEQSRAVARRKKAIQSAFAEGGVDDRSSKVPSSARRRKATNLPTATPSLGITVLQYLIAVVVVLLAGGVFYLLLEYV